MMVLVERYSLERKLEDAWASLLSYPQQLVMDAVVGTTSMNRLEYGIKLTANVIEVGIQAATQPSIDGLTALYNEVKK
eukprot:3843279-Prymnesium_polylepis.1